MRSRSGDDIREGQISSTNTSPRSIIPTKQQQCSSPSSSPPSSSSYSPPSITKSNSSTSISSNSIPTIITGGGQSRHKLASQFKIVFSEGSGVIVKDRKLHDQTLLPQCFVGIEVVDVLVRTQGLIRRQAMEWGQLFMDKGLIDVAIPIGSNTTTNTTTTTTTSSSYFTSEPSPSTSPRIRASTLSSPLVKPSSPHTFEDKFTFYRLTDKGRALIMQGDSKRGLSHGERGGSGAVASLLSPLNAKGPKSPMPVRAVAKNILGVATTGASPSASSPIVTSPPPPSILVPEPRGPRDLPRILQNRSGSGAVSPVRQSPLSKSDLGAVDGQEAMEELADALRRQGAAGADLKKAGSPTPLSRKRPLLKNINRHSVASLPSRRDDADYQDDELSKASVSSPAMARGAPGDRLSVNRADSHWDWRMSSSPHAGLGRNNNMQGWLEKESHSQPGKWKRRYIVLSDGATQWYRDAPKDGDVMAQGRIPMDVVGGVRMAPEKHEFAFCIDAVTRSFVLRASNRDELNDWVFAFHRAALSVVQLLMDPDHMPREARLRLAKWWKDRGEMSGSREKSGEDILVESKGEDGGEGISAGVAWTAGRRPSMEDAHFIVTQLCEECDWLDSDCRQAAFGIFDGHGGLLSAEWCSLRMMEYIARDTAFSTNPADAFVRGFQEADKALCATLLEKNDRSGCCALVVAISGNELTVGHVGDCRAVLVIPSVDDPEEMVVDVLTQDHKPNVPKEKERIEHAGGFVQVHAEPDMSSLLRRTAAELAELQRTGGLGALPTVSISRVQGSLSVSRAMGDTGFKMNKKVLFQKDFVDDLVIAKPEVGTRSLGKGNLSFLILACDGLWDVLTNEKAAFHCWQVLQKGGTPKDAAHALVQKSIERGTLDNVSVMVVRITDN